MADDRWQQTLDMLASSPAGQIGERLKEVNESGEWQTRIDRPVYIDGQIAFICSVPYLPHKDDELRCFFTVRKEDGKWTKV